MKSMRSRSTVSTSSSASFSLLPRATRRRTFPSLGNAPGARVGGSGSAGVISHDRRRILHFNVTPHPTSNWIVQQMREAFPYESTPKFLIFDHDAKYGFEVPAAIRSMKIACVQSSVQSPWQNGVAERWVGSCRRELLDPVIPLNERHLKQ